MSAARAFAGGIVALGLVGTATTARAGDAGRGRLLYEARCSGCHSPDVHRVGPAHRGVVGRQAGTVPGYDYSAALKSSGLNWTTRNLDLWLADPEALVPGQMMGFRVDDAADRADLVAYLEVAMTERTPP